MIGRLDEEPFFDEPYWYEDEYDDDEDIYFSYEPEDDGYEGEGDEEDW